MQLDDLSWPKMTERQEQKRQKDRKTKRQKDKDTKRQKYELTKLGNNRKMKRQKDKNTKRQKYEKTGKFERLNCICILAHLVPCQTKKQCKQVAYVVFPLCGYQNIYFPLTPIKSGIFGQNFHLLPFGPKLTFLAKYRHFWPIWSNARPKNNADKLPMWFFRYVGTKTFTFPLPL